MKIKIVIDVLGLGVYEKTKEFIDRMIIFDNIIVGDMKFSVNEINYHDDDSYVIHCVNTVNPITWFKDDSKIHHTLIMNDWVKIDG